MDDSRSETLKKVEAKLDSLGLPQPDKPAPHDEEGEVVSWPDNVADLESEELAHHMTWWTGWSVYARYHLGRAETDLSAMSQNESRERAKWLFSSRGDYDTVTEAKASWESRPDTAKVKARTLECQALVTMLKAMLEGYQSKYATISRELSRRGAERVETERNSRFTT